MTDGRDDLRQAGKTSNKYAAKKAASERLAAQRAAQQKAARRRNIMITGSATLAIVIVIVVIVVIGVTHKSGSKPVAASDTVTSALKSASTSTLGSSVDVNAATNPPIPITGGSALTGSNGLPQVLYVGAEWCPNCAATRWPMALALSRFGTFSNLTTMYSAEDNIPTLSFHGSTYTSEYIEFDGKEEVDQQNKPLDKLNAQEAHLFQTLGVAPGQTNPGYPFIDFGGKWRQLGTIYDPSILSGMAPEAVANAMGDPSTRAGKSIQASADVYTAILCGLDGDKPANVCSAPSVTAAKAALNGSGK